MLDESLLGQPDVYGGWLCLQPGPTLEPGGTLLCTRNLDHADQHVATNGEVILAVWDDSSWAAYAGPGVEPERGEVRHA